MKLEELALRYPELSEELAAVQKKFFEKRP